jgi:hypothetical protein
MTEVETLALKHGLQTRSHYRSEYLSADAPGDQVDQSASRQEAPKVDMIDNVSEPTVRIGAIQASPIAYAKVQDPKTVASEDVIDMGRLEIGQPSRKRANLVHRDRSA